MNNKNPYQRNLGHSLNICTNWNISLPRVYQKRHAVISIFPFPQFEKDHVWYIIYHSECGATDDVLSPISNNTWVNLKEINVSKTLSRQNSINLQRRAAST